MMFNNRRQSRDRVLIDNMIKMVGDDKLYIAPYSEGLFENKEIKLKVKKNPLKAADEGYDSVEFYYSYKEINENIVSYDIKTNGVFSIAKKYYKDIKGVRCEANSHGSFKINISR